MSGAGTGPNEERDLLAGEYVLGTLEPAEAQRVAEQAREDAALAAAIAAWQTRLAPLTLLATPVIPPPGVWNRIADSTGLRQPDRAPRTSRWATLWHDTAAWRWATGASLAAAVVALVVALQPSGPSPFRTAALLPKDLTAAAFLADETPRGGLRLRALTPITVAPGKDLELWALPPGATRPVPLGVIPVAEQRLVVSHPEVRLTEHTQLMVSLEPKGGSPTGQPTGPVLFAGTLAD